jgi:hypothetical protein
VSAASADRKSVKLTATFAESNGQVRASIVVRFPAGSLIGNKRASSLHPDMIAAENWVRAEARRRGIEWEPQEQGGTAAAPPG